ncbi:hypothetical protein KSP40_PGU001296 [Platanthera guangdongensis]|uniref:Uncharacterized protein n=1 Tax=Platanthera guangdongensis TaxID=2320717 RepID=A0ABR2MRG8_9ASPA
MGLMGFNYRNDELFCGKHRHSDRHGCCCHYKPAGQITISRDKSISSASLISKFGEIFPSNRSSFVPFRGAREEMAWLYFFCIF